MDKSLITGFFLAAIPWTAGAAQEPTEVYLSCGFDDGIPATFMRSDNDGCELHFTMTQLGFESRDSWITLREEGTENIYAASTLARHPGNMDKRKLRNPFMERDVGQ